tara:strand:- start:67 stop:300 length:234 start_codon:yes stop_codon:yes gene_type:complete
MYKPFNGSIKIANYSQYKCKSNFIVNMSQTEVCVDVTLAKTVVIVTVISFVVLLKRISVYTHNIEKVNDNSSNTKKE